MDTNLNEQADFDFREEHYRPIADESEDQNDETNEQVETTNGQEQEKKVEFPLKEDVPVPEIVVEEISRLPDIQEVTPIRKKAAKMIFPLSQEDELDLVKLTMRFDNHDHIAGLSAPQIGINKRAFIFSVNEEESDQPFKKSLWINPAYKNAPDATLDEDYETCYSLAKEEEHIAGPVFRFNRIFYRAFEADGRIVEGEARGYAARVIQHEIDHLDGNLFIDYVQPERLLTLSEYTGKLEAGTVEEMQSGIVPESYQ